MSAVVPLAFSLLRACQDMLLGDLRSPSIVLVLGPSSNLSDSLAAARPDGCSRVVLANENVSCGPVIGHREAFGSLCPTLAGTEAIGDSPVCPFPDRVGASPNGRQEVVRVLQSYFVYSYYLVLHESLSSYWQGRRQLHFPDVARYGS